jgi:hypothetical protein
MQAPLNKERENRSAATNRNSGAVRPNRPASEIPLKVVALFARVTCGFGLLHRFNNRIEVVALGVL